MKINWTTLPYHNEWQRKYDSIMNLGAKVTWPQLICEMIIDNRIKYIKTFPKISKGEGWSQPISGQVRRLIQQCYSICNYFPSIEQEPLVELAFRSVIKNQRICKIGTYRKNRVSKTGKCTVSNDEKDFVLAVSYQLESLVSKRDNIIKIASEPVVEKPKEVEYKPNQAIINAPKKRGMTSLLDIEKRIMNG
jgi:hypothetical protein